MRSGICISWVKIQYWLFNFSVGSSKAINIMCLVMIWLICVRCFSSLTRVFTCIYLNCMRIFRLKILIVINIPPPGLSLYLPWCFSIRKSQFYWIGYGMCMWLMAGKGLFQLVCGGYIPMKIKYLTWNLTQRSIF